MMNVILKRANKSGIKRFRNEDGAWKAKRTRQLKQDILAKIFLAVEFVNVSQTTTKLWTKKELMVHSLVRNIIIEAMNPDVRCSICLEF